MWCWSRSCLHLVQRAETGECQAMVIRASELVICKSVDGHFDKSRSEEGSWNCVGSLSTHFNMVSNVVQCCRGVQKEQKEALNWSDKVYWQVADTRRRASEGEVSSRSTQLGKEDFCIVVIVPIWIDRLID